MWKVIAQALILIGLSTNAFANIAELNDNKSVNRLREIQTNIRNVEQQLQSARGQLQNLQENLRVVEIKISAQEKSLGDLTRRLQQTNARIKKIGLKITTTEQLRQQQAQHLTKQIETQYTMHQQSPLKLLLNQEDPLQVQRMFTYLSYINQARVADIKRYNNTLTKLAALKERALITLAKAHELYASTEQEKLALDLEYTKRTQIVLEIQQSLQSNEASLVDLKKDELRLKELVAKIGSALSDIPAQFEQKQAFKARRSKLLWPTLGKITSRFGRQQGNSSLHNNGIIIAAPIGQQVRTVHGGRIAYADWLRGFGLLTIVDHGDGYMTLYAHTQTLYKEIGDWVEPNEIIATVGKTGGVAEPGLYFEVRKDGSPVNPLNFLK